MKRLQRKASTIVEGFQEAIMEVTNKSVVEDVLNDELDCWFENYIGKFNNNELKDIDDINKIYRNEGVKLVLKHQIQTI